MIESGEFRNPTGVTRMTGFKAGLVNCREAAYLSKTLQWMLKKLRPLKSMLDLKK